MEENNELINNPAVEYTDDNIRHLSDMEHVRTRPGMYIGKLGDGSHAEDGIYVLLKEVLDNSIDEFKMQAGKKIEIIIEENLRVSVRDYGRGIPQGKLIEAVSVLNTGGKYDSKAFKKSVGLNGVGVKAVNALSFALPYDQQDYEFIGVEPLNLKAMENLTYDRLHTSGQKALYPTFVNLGDKETLEGTSDLFILKLKAKRKVKFNLKAIDGILVDQDLNMCKF